MAIDYDAIARAGGLGKGTPIRTKIEQAKAAWQKVDERESRKVRRRSGGQCEVRVGDVRCPDRARHVHHHMGGSGVRGRGASAHARHKSHGNHYRVR